MDFRSPDYEPLDGFVGFIMHNTSSWKTGDSVDERKTFGKKIYSDVRSDCMRFHSKKHYRSPSYTFLPIHKMILN
jgi:hypothetical protein